MKLQKELLIQSALRQTHLISSTYASILHGVKALKSLQQVHAQIITSGNAQNIFLSNRLMNSYASFNLLQVAEQIFQKIPLKNVVSWTVLISGFTKRGLYSKAFDVFSEMKRNGILPNSVTVTAILPAIANLGLIEIGRLLHCFLIRNCLEINVFVETALVDMYAKFGKIGVARKLFDEMPERSVVSWNAIISGYSENRLGEEAIRLFKMMQRNGFVADSITIMGLLEACSEIACQRVGGVVHGFTLSSGYDENDILVKTALMDMYVKQGCVNDAYQIFSEELPIKDVVAWTLMLSSFSDVGYGNQAMRILDEMLIRISNVLLDSAALMGMFSCCSRSGALQQGKRVHALTIKTGFGNDTFVGSAIIDMYSNCGNLESAKRYFEGMNEKDVVCWNAMIAGYGMSGHGDDAIALFFQMEGSRVEPDEATLVCILCACSHAGMVDQGTYIFYLIVNKLQTGPNLQHYACLVDLLGRAGRLDDAFTLINNMPLEPDAGVYGAMLGACRIHRNIELGSVISEKLFELNPNDAGYYVLLSNMYASVGNWDGVKLTRISLKSKGLKKIPGLSTIELGREVYTFMAGDKCHPQYTIVNDILRSLIKKIEMAGYVPDIRFVFQDVPDETKREILLQHSEKLAIAFGIMMTEPGTPIRIVKNLRMCDDCHNASKFISKSVGREIVIKDTNRFHIFKDGICSCKDYW